MNDHRLIKILINQLIETHNQERQLALFEQIADEIELHELIESQTFYDAFRDTDNKLVNTIIDHADNDHVEITILLDQLADTDPRTDQWNLLLGQLKQAVEHHFRDEETILFSLARQTISPVQALALANEMNILKHRHRPTGSNYDKTRKDEKPFLARLFG